MRPVERLDAFMARANAAYYATRDPFADFTTAPEISQVFGELLGAVGGGDVAGDGRARPGDAGRGRAGPRHADGRCAARDRRGWRRSSRAALRLHLVETSPRLRAVQARAPARRDLARAAGRPAATGRCCCSPTSSSTRCRSASSSAAARGWTERLRGGRAASSKCPPPRPARRGAARGRGAWRSREPRRARLAARASARAAGRRAAARRCSSTTARSAARRATACRRCADGRPADPLADPGTADLTAHVDFAALAAAARAAGAAVFRARCRKACSSPGSACSSAPTCWRAANRRRARPR